MKDKSFQITLINGFRYWPASIFSKDAALGESSEKDLEGIEKILDRDGYIFVQASGVDQKGEAAPHKNVLIHKTDISYIQGPIEKYDAEELSINEVFSLTEAATYWGIPNGSTIRKAIERGRFREGEHRKSETVNLITYPAMQRVFGAVPITIWDKVPILSCALIVKEEGFLDRDLFIRNGDKNRKYVTRSFAARKKKNEEDLK